MPFAGSAKKPAVKLTGPAPYAALGSNPSLAQRAIFGVPASQNELIASSLAVVIILAGLVLITAFCYQLKSAILKKAKVRSGIPAKPTSTTESDEQTIVVLLL